MELAISAPYSAAFHRAKVRGSGTHLNSFMKCAEPWNPPPLPFDNQSFPLAAVLA